MRKPTICICENKDTDQLCGNREADLRLCFHYTDSTISLLPKYKFSSFEPISVLVKLCVRPVPKPHCWFSHEVAHMKMNCVTMNMLYIAILDGY